MKRLLRRFVIFTLVLAGSFAILVQRSCQQIVREERSLARGAAEQVFDQIQAQVSELLAAEDERSFGEFRFFLAAAGERPGESTLVRSPLSRLPEDDVRGLVGYFQIDPDGAFSTPYLPVGQRRAADISASDLRARTERQALLSNLTVSLQERVRAGTTRMETARESAPFVELGTASKDIPIGDFEPLDEKKKLLEAKGYERGRRGEVARMAPPRGEMPTEEQLRVFEEQKRAATKLRRAAPVPPGGPRQVSIDPFQARLVERRYVVFYRKLWLDQTLYLQGFALDAERFFDVLMERSFARSSLAAFAVATLGLRNDEMFRYEAASVRAGAGPPLFQRSLSYPLNAFVWRVRAESYPPLAARDILAVVAGLAAVLLAFGLVSIYRTAAAEVRLSRKRQDLVSAVTHELRTPLTSIRMYAEMLEEGITTDDAKRQEYYRQLSRESARLSRLVENVLQLARLENKTYRVERQVRAPSEDFEEISRELRALVERQGFRLTCRGLPDAPAIAYDPDAVRQILLALLDNSMKFAADGADRTFVMSLDREGPTVVWAWSDRGPGVPPGELGRIFTAFHRVEGEATRRTKGTGIGLAIARMLAESMGARIEARNLETTKGGGLEVRLIFQAVGEGAVSSA
jgi:signal transduction histidine kinase